MMRAHRRTWNGQRSDRGLTDFERRRLKSRFRRRMQTSGMIVCLGVMLGGDAFVWKLGMVFATFYWILVIGLAMWLLLLGLGDLTEVTVDSRMAKDELHQLDDQRRELEAEVVRLRQHRSNGDAGQSGPAGAGDEDNRDDRRPR